MFIVPADPKPFSLTLPNATHAQNLAQSKFELTNNNYFSSHVRRKVSALNELTERQERIGAVMLSGIYKTGPYQNQVREEAAIGALPKSVPGKAKMIEELLRQPNRRDYNVDDSGNIAVRESPFNLNAIITNSDSFGIRNTALCTGPSPDDRIISKKFLEIVFSAISDGQHEHNIFTEGGFYKFLNAGNEGISLRQFSNGGIILAGDYVVVHYTDNCYRPNLYGIGRPLHMPSYDKSCAHVIDLKDINVSREQFQAMLDNPNENIVKLGSYFSTYFSLNIPLDKSSLQ